VLLVVVVVVVVPMRSECRERRHSGRSAIIRASVVPARSGTGKPMRMGSADQRASAGSKPVAISAS
jgi:hypothetical protein